MKYVIRRKRQREPIHRLGPGGFRLFHPTGSLPAPKPIDFLAKPAIRRGAIVMLVALGGSLKSWVALQLCFAVATGGEWMGAFPCAKGRTTYLDYETSEENLSVRVQRLCRGRGRSSWPKRLDLCSRPDAFFDSSGFEERLLALARERDLIVIDSFRASAPALDENDSRASAPLDMLGRIAAQTKCTFLVIHHPKKGENAKKIDPREMMRGSTSIFAALDAAFRISKKGGRFVVEQIKSREDVPISSLSLHLDDTNGVALVGTDLGAAEAPEVPEEMVQKICEVLAKTPGLSDNQLKDLVRGNDGRRRAALKLLATRNEIVNEGNPRRASWRLLSGDGRVSVRDEADSRAKRSRKRGV